MNTNHFAKCFPMSLTNRKKGDLFTTIPLHGRVDLPAIFSSHLAICTTKVQVLQNDIIIDFLIQKRANYVDL